MQGATGRAEAAGNVARAIVGQDSPDLDALGAKPLRGSAEKPGHGPAAFVGQQFDVGHAGMVINGDMQTLPADAVVEIHVPGAASDAVTGAGDPPKLLRVQMQQTARTRVPRAQTAAQRRAVAVVAYGRTCSCDSTVLKTCSRTGVVCDLLSRSSRLTLMTTAASASSK